MNPLRWMFQFALCCHHGHLSRVFTIKKRTYKVCLGCGEEFVLPNPYHQIPITSHCPTLLITTAHS